jgi:hypothetical protein
MWKSQEQYRWIPIWLFIAFFFACLILMMASAHGQCVSDGHGDCIMPISAHGAFIAYPAKPITQDQTVPAPDPRHWNCIPAGKGWDCTEGPAATGLDEKKKPRKGLIRSVAQPTYQKALKPAGKAIKRALW